MSTTIASVEALALALPLDAPVALSSRRVAERHYTLVRVRDSDGATGIGFCYAGHTGSTVVAEAVRVLLRPVLEGRDPARISSLSRSMQQSALLLGRAGAVMRAISAVDIALWDLAARRAGMPLWRLLGADGDPVRAYASGGYYLEGKTVEGLRDEVRAWVEAGFTEVKMKVGRGGLSEEVARVEAAREELGDAGLLMLDANNAWRSVDGCLEFLRRVADCSPYWIEEPFAPDDVRGCQQIRGRTSALVATGEQGCGLTEFQHLVTADAVDILQPDAAVCGGVTEFLRISDLAQQNRVSVAPHWFDDLHVHLVAALPNATMVEFFTDDTVFNFRTVITERLRVRNGWIDLPSEPGLGFDFDDACANRFAVQPWS